MTMFATWINPLIVVLSLSLSASANDVVELNTTSFDALVSSDYSLWLVTFYSAERAPLDEAFGDAATSLARHGVKFGAVDLDVKSNVKLASQYAVSQLPTIKVFASPPKPNAYTGKMYRDVTEYSGVRDARGLKRFASKAMPSYFVRLSDGGAKSEGPTVAQFIKATSTANRGLAAAVLVTTKEKLPPMWKSISATYADRLRLGQAVRSDSAAVLAAVGVDEEEAPALVAFGPKGERAQYAGSMKDGDAVAAFLDQYASAERVTAEDAMSDADSKKKGSKGSGASVKAARRLGGATTLVTMDDFKAQVLNSTSAWVVVYIDGPPEKGGPVEKAIARAGKKAAKGYGVGDDAVVRVGVVDCVLAKKNKKTGTAGPNCPKKREAEAGVMQRATARLYPFGEDKPSNGKPVSFYFIDNVTEYYTILILLLIQ